MSETISFAVIGCGRIGQRHIEMIKNLPTAELIAVCDVKPAADLPLPAEVPHYTSVEAMLAAHPSLDVVAIATPNGCHAQQALQVIAAGAHPIIEKPMALTRRDAEKVLHAALQKGKYVFGVMQNRYSPPSEWLKEVVDRGLLGEIYQVHVDCFWNRDDRYYYPGGWHGTKDLDGGTLFTQFSHFIDILYWLFGDITPTAVKLNNFNHVHSIQFEDSGMVQFDLVQGGVGIVELLHVGLGRKPGVQHDHYWREGFGQGRRAIHERGSPLPHRGICHADARSQQSAQQLRPVQRVRRQPHLCL